MYGLGPVIPSGRSPRTDSAGASGTSRGRDTPPGPDTGTDARDRDANAAVAGQIEEYWTWAAGALFLLVTLDLLTTLYAAAAVGVAAESNPVTAWLLRRPIGVLVGVNVAAATVATLCFDGLMTTFRRTPARIRPYYGLLIEAWLGVLLAAGLCVFANNLAVVVLGRSLLP